MTRLQRHQQKQFVKSLVFSLFVIIAIFYFLLAFGIRILLTATSFIANIGSKNNAPTTKNSEVLSSIEIDNIPSATNSARFVVSGSVVNFSVLDFYINGQQVKETNLPSADSFSEEIGDLTEGDNQIYIIAKTQDKQTTKKTNTYNVLYKSTKPKLDIKSPQDKSTTSQDYITVSGTTDKETFVKINDTPAVVDASGNFQMNLKLKDGNNTINITATDVAGNTSSQTLTVTLQKQQ